jgi:hypothetical protein
MAHCGDSRSASEVKLACAYKLLNDGFAEMTEALARIDENAAWGTLAAINGRIARTLREEGARLAAKGYAPDELKEVASRLSETILAASQAVNTRGGHPEAPRRAPDPQQEPLEFANLVLEAQRTNRKAA